MFTKPSQAKPSQAKPSQAKPSQAYSRALKISALALAVAAVGGCGGGSKADIPAAKCKSSEIYDAVSKACAPAISGVVADGYIKGATVFWDCNADMVAGASESFTKTAQGGVFKIKASNDAACQLTASVPIGAIDEDFPSLRVIQPYTMLAVRGHESFISPLSTIVSAQMQMNGGDIDAASQLVSNLLNVEKNSLLSNYLSSSNKKLHGVAQVAAQVLQNNYVGGQAQASVANAHSQMMLLGPKISAANLDSQEAVNNFLDPIGVFLSAFYRTEFVKNPLDEVKIRPNSTLNLNADQISALTEVIQDEDVKKVTRYGVIHWSELSYEKITEIHEKIKNKKLLADENNELVKKIRTNRTNAQARMTDYFEKNMKKENNFFARDVSKNFNFAADTIVSVLDGVTGVIAASGKDFDLKKKFRKVPILKKYLKKNKIIDKKLSKDLLLALATSVAGVTNSADLLSQAIDAPDGQALTKDQADAALNVMDNTVTYMRDVLKNKDFKKIGKAFGPALKIYGVTEECEFAEGQSNVINPQCWAAILEITELLLEQLGYSKLQGALQVVRAGFDAYNQGVEYAAVTDKEVSLAQDVVSKDWDNKKQNMLLIAKAMEFQAGGYDQYFEAYIDIAAPSIEWKTNPANGHQYAAVDCGTWTQCEAKAVELGGHLVSVNNAVEDEWLKNNFPMTSHYWIGATNDGIQGQWRWTSGEAFSYTNWGANLNNLGGNENCAQYYSVTAGVWNDVQCNAPDIQSAIFEKSPDGTFFQVPVGAWMAWDGSKYLASQVKVTPDYITNTMSNWGGLRVRLPKMIDGDNFKVEFRAKNDPSLGGSYAYDLGFGVRNDFSSGQKNASGIEVPTRHVSFTMTNGYFNDFFQVVSDSGDTGRLNRSGFVNTRVWHNYVLQVKNHVISLYVDGALTHQQNYSGNMGMLDTFGIGGKNNLQIDAANMSFSQP